MDIKPVDFSDEMFPDRWPRPTLEDLHERHKEYEFPLGCTYCKAELDQAQKREEAWLAEAKQRVTSACDPDCVLDSRCPEYKLCRRIEAGL